MGRKERFYVDVMALHPEVTGSCSLVVVKYPDGDSTRFIVDCGLFQEEEYKHYNQDFPFDCTNCEFVLITHDHTDHVGRLPLLVKKGFNGHIYMSETSKILLPIVLKDCQKVMSESAKRWCQKELYSEANTFEACGMAVECKYEETIYINRHIKATFFVNGHLLGAAIILVQISFPGYDDINILFTGDYNSKNLFFEVPQLPDWVLELPLTVVQEATYGNMNSNIIVPSLEDNIVMCMNKNKTAVCMAFSLGRYQEVLYILKIMKERGKIDDSIPIYLDGKLALRYTTLYPKLDIIRPELKDFLPTNIRMVDKTLRESLMENQENKIILTTSGMGTYGPAQRYIPSYISQQDCLLQFTGYTAEGTLGRQLKDTTRGEKVVINGLVKKKLANVEYTNELSAHAKADEMIAFLKSFKNLKLVLINHGEYAAKQKFSFRVSSEIKAKNVAILGRDYLFRINPYGLVRSFSTSFD